VTADRIALWQLPVWSEEEAAEALGWTFGELQTQRMKHGLPYVKSGKRVLYMRDSVVAWAKERELTNATGRGLVGD